MHVEKGFALAQFDPAQASFKSTLIALAEFRVTSLPSPSLKLLISPTPVQ
ncbi:hypothetical protein [Methylomonas koyamae]|nr:hypothetical protein [Methylomonas koyamae]